jgi:hypothetical protein
MNLFRWIAVFPAACIIGYLASVLVAVMFGVGIRMHGTDPNSLMPKTVMMLGTYVTLGLAFVQVGGHTAPQFKVQIGWVLTLILAVFLVYQAGISGDRWDVAVVLFALLGSLVGLARLSRHNR